MQDPNTPPEHCAACGAPFECGMLAGRESCWCAAMPPLALVESGRGCLCPTCLAEELRRQESSSGV